MMMSTFRGVSLELLIWRNRLIRRQFISSFTFSCNLCHDKILHFLRKKNRLESKLQLSLSIFISLWALISMRKCSNLARHAFAVRQFLTAFLLIFHNFSIKIIAWELQKACLHSSCTCWFMFPIRIARFLEHLRSYKMLHTHFGSLRHK